MAINIRRENMGVVFTPRDEEVYSNTSGVLYPRVIELHILHIRPAQFF